MTMPFRSARAARRLASALVLALLLPAPRGLAEEVDGPAGPRVSIPLADYESLRKLREAPSLTVVDTLRVSGSFASRTLALSLSGRSSGTLPAATLLESIEGAALAGCDGSALVSRGTEAAYTLTPLGARFEVRCRLVPSSGDRLSFVAGRAVLFPEGDVADGEFLPGPDPGDGTRPFTVVRRIAADGEALAPTATGRYRITLLPDETRFRFTIEVRNPNRGRAPFDLVLGSGERVQEVVAPGPYDVKEGRTRFDLPPGDGTIVLTGTLGGTEFHAPVDAALSYLLLESHPLLRAEARTAAKRVSPQETGMPREFRGGQAFLLGKGDAFAWSVKRLEALRSTSYAVRATAQTLFVPADGPVLGQSLFELDNQGASDLALPSSPEPTYAAFGDEAVFLTRNEKGELWLPLASGPQALLLQSRQGLGRSLGFAAGSLAVPHLPVPSTRYAVELRYPDAWVPLYERFGGESRLAVPSIEACVVFLLLSGWLFGLLGALRFEPRRAALLAGLLALSAFASDTAAYVVVAAAIVLTVVWIAAVARERRPRLRTLVALGALGAFAALVVLAVAIPSGLLRSRGPEAPPAEVAFYSESASAPVARKAVRSDAPASPAPEPQAAGGPSYEGLPAKVELPRGARSTWWSREMLAADAAPVVRVVLAGRTLVSLAQGLAVLSALGLLWWSRPSLREGLRALRARGRQEVPAGR
ncbi:MAG TPA: hypothetical protein PLP50_11300 [Thermoanaerobaculia bacterium]|nr:hypothetical protein [Thermoanaerobaculia bacterium]